MIRPALALLFLAPLAACNGGSEGNSTTISFNVNSSDGDVVGGVDANGSASIKVPGFEGSIKLPKMNITADNLDLNDLHLYPGSSVKGVNIDGQDGPGNHDSGKVHVTFESAAKADAVRAWFQKDLAKSAASVTAQSNGFTGKTHDGSDYAIELSPAGDKTSGTIVISGTGDKH